MMAKTVKSFSATHYNPLFIKDNSSVACPPYDTISAKQLVSLRKKSSYNFSNILIADNNDYKKTRITMDEWLKKRVLIDDERESIYLYEQRFHVEKKLFRRFGFLSLLKMDKKNIFPHECTLKGPKEDRKQIIKTAEANLSPIFVIAARPLEIFRKIYKCYCGKKPFLNFRDDENNINRIWKIQDKKHIFEICREIDKSELVIADGHHRFEISYDYFKKNKNRFKDLDYILAYITDRQKGVVILPTHRVIDIKDKDGEFFKKLEKYFRIKKVTKNVLEKKIRSKGKFCMGVCRNAKFYFLELKTLSILDKISDAVYRQLDTCVFHQLILPLFKTDSKIEYTHSVKEAEKMAGKKKTVFFLRAALIDSVFKISSKGFRLPQKTTYFYPKILSGIVLRRFKPLRGNVA